tara:strand:- start:1010 stop:1489 length:480 start_codon:yes stop_codon:yes gene_type:complete
MPYGSGTDPRTATLKTGALVKGPGKLLTMDGTNNTLDILATTQVTVGVSAGDSSRTAAGVLQAAAGATVSYYPATGVLMVQSIAGQTYTTGCLVYGTALGLCTATAGSEKCIGVYVGEGEVSPALVANGAGDSEQTDAATLLLSEGAMIPVNMNTGLNA